MKRWSNAGMLDGVFEKLHASREVMSSLSGQVRGNWSRDELPRGMSIGTPHPVWKAVGTTDRR